MLLALELGDFGTPFAFGDRQSDAMYANYRRGVSQWSLSGIFAFDSNNYLLLLQVRRRHVSTCAHFAFISSTRVVDWFRDTFDF